MPLPFTVLALVSLASAQQAPRLLSLPMADAHLGDVAGAAFTPDGTRVLFLDTFPFDDLWSVPIDGGAAVKLNSDAIGKEVAPGFLFGAAGQRVVFRARHRHPGRLDIESEALDLFAAPLDGSAPPVELGEGICDDFRVSPDGARVVYRSGRANSNLISAPITGGNREDLLDRVNEVGASGFRILPDSSQVVFRADRTRGELQLFRRPIVGRATPVQISAPFVDIGDVEPDFELQPDGARVVYRADVGLDGSIDLLSSPLVGTEVVSKLNANTTPLGDVTSFRLTPDGTRVIYVGDQERAGTRELFSARLDDSLAPVRLNAPLVAGGTVLDGYLVDARSARVVYRVALDDRVVALDSAPIDGSAPSVRLAGPLRTRDAVADDFRITPNGRRVIYRADPDGDRIFDLYSVPIGGGTPVRLDAANAAVSDFALAPSSVYFRAEQATPGVPELFAAPFGGGRPAVRVHPGLAFGHAVGEFVLAADGRKLLYLADPLQRGVFELFRASANSTPGLVRLSPDFVHAPYGPTPVQDFVVSGGRALYRGGQELGDVVGLYSVPLDGSAPPIALSTPQPSAGGVLTRAVTADGARVVFVQGGEHRQDELFVAPLDGSTPTRRLDAPVQARCDVAPRFVLTADSRNALFVADQERDETFELYRVALDAIAAPVRLHPPLRDGRSVKATFQATPDGSRVVFASDLRIARRFELYVAPLDGSTPPRQLSQKANGSGDVRAITLTRDGTRALYLADQEVDEQFELYSVPLDLTQPPRRLSGPLVANGDVREFALDPTDRWAVYLADQDVNERRELYAVPLDGSAPAHRLNHAALDAVDSFLVTPDGTRVVYLSRQVGDACIPYVVPLDGSAPAQLLDGHFGYRPTWDYRVTPDSSRLVFRFEGLGRWDNQVGLFSVPLDASRRATILHVPSILSQPFALAADGSSVVYASHPADDFARALWRVPVDGPNQAAVALVGGIQGDVTALEEHGSTLVFLAGGSLYSF